MPNGRTMLLIFLCVLFVVASAFGQEESDSHIVTVPKKIDLIELDENVGDLSKTVGVLNKTIGELSKTVGELNKTVGGLDERTKGTAKVVHVILGSIFAPLAVAIIILAGQKWLINRKSEDKVTSSDTAQASQSETTPTQVAQDNVDTGDPTLHELLKELLVKLDTPPVEEISSRRPSTTVPGGDKPIDDLTNDDYATMEKV